MAPFVNTRTYLPGLETLPTSDDRSLVVSVACDLVKLHAGIHEVVVADASTITEVCALEHSKCLSGLVFKPAWSSYFGGDSDVDQMNEFLQTKLLNICELDKPLLAASEAKISDRLGNMRPGTDTRIVQI